MSSLEGGGFAVHLGRVPEWVRVRPFADGAAFEVWCERCRVSVAAYTSLVRKDPEVIAREVERHAKCEEG